MRKDRKQFSSAINLSWILSALILVTPLPVFYRTWINDAIRNVALNFVNQIILFFAPDQNVYPVFYTDSLGYWVLLLITAFVAVGSWFLLAKLFNQKLLSISKLADYVLLCSVSWVFMVYGFSKLFHNQFPDLSQVDIRFDAVFGELKFWRYMSQQPVLIYLSAFVELLVSGLLLFQKTRRIGVALALISALFIFVLNLYFDIPVKAFSGLLLIASLWLMLLLFKSDFKPLILETRHKIPLKFLLISSMLITAYF